MDQLQAGGAFSNCDLKNVDICGESSNFCVLGCLLVEKSTFRACSLVCCVRDLCAPASVSELCDRCFYRCSDLRRALY